MGATKATAALALLPLAALVAASGASRADAPVGRYVVDGGTVQDMKTHLTWTQAASPTPVLWADASTYCGSLALAGTGWRVPSVNELQTLVDEARSNPSIDPTAFPATQADLFWTSSNLAGFTNLAWAVSFVYGLSIFADVAQPPHWVRCVR